MKQMMKTTKQNLRVEEGNDSKEEFDELYTTVKRNSPQGADTCL